MSSRSKVTVVGAGVAGLTTALELAERHGWPVEDRAVMPEELDEASEVFLCATAAEIVPVGAIDHRRYQIGPITRTLMDDFQKLVRQPDSEGFGESAHLAEA